MGMTPSFLPPPLGATAWCEHLLKWAPTQMGPGCLWLSAWPASLTQGWCGPLVATVSLLQTEEDLALAQRFWGDPEKAGHQTKQVYSLWECLSCSFPPLCSVPLCLAV